MRDIKFRGKSLLNNAWIVGYLIIDNISDKYYILPNGNSCNESDKIGEEGLLHILTFEVAKETIGQYTGLKKIYEGDIVKVFTSKEWRIGKIIYEHSGFTIDVTNNKELEYGRTDILENLTEVIGNIYDNPELLEEGE